MEIHKAAVAELAAQVIDAYRNRGSGRFLLGITGIPAAGKSTLAANLTKAINRQVAQDMAVVVPMDGFHYHNDILRRRNLLPLKGIPETFDGEGFVALVKRLAGEPEAVIGCPAYDRRLHNPVLDGICVVPGHKIIIIEGNYLLLDSKPWCELAALLHEIWFIDTPSSVTRGRLIRRHSRSGRTVAEAVRKIESTDRPNAELIRQSRSRADKVIMLRE